MSYLNAEWVPGVILYFIHILSVAIVPSLKLNVNFSLSCVCVCVFTTKSSKKHSPHITSRRNQENQQFRPIKFSSKKAETQISCLIECKTILKYQQFIICFLLYSFFRPSPSMKPTRIEHKIKTTNQIINKWC